MNFCLWRKWGGRSTRPRSTRGRRSESHSLIPTDRPSNRRFTPDATSSSSLSLSLPPSLSFSLFRPHQLTHLPGPSYPDRRLLDGCKLSLHALTRSILSSDPPFHPGESVSGWRAATGSIICSLVPSRTTRVDLHFRKRNAKFCEDIVALRVH